MSKIVLALTFLFLTGCATKDQLYYEAAKSISKDNTIAQTACFSAVTEIAKNADNGAKIGAIALAEKCKSNILNVTPPPRNILGL